MVRTSDLHPENTGSNPVMATMETAFIISIIFNLLSIFLIGLLFTGVNKLAGEKIDLQDKLIQKDRQLRQAVSDKKMIDLLQAFVPPTPKLSFDKKTHTLLTIAVQNRNENESRNAAVEACKLIHKKLNG